MLAGRVNGEKTSLSSLFEAVGKFNAGNITEDELKKYECKACPSCGSCSGMYTANSMNCLCEALGLALPGNGTILATSAERKTLYRNAAFRIVEMAKRFGKVGPGHGLLPREIAQA